MVATSYLYVCMYALMVDHAWTLCWRVEMDSVGGEVGVTLCFPSSSPSLSPLSLFEAFVYSTEASVAQQCVAW